MAGLGRVIIVIGSSSSSSSEAKSSSRLLVSSADEEDEEYSDVDGLELGVLAFRDVASLPPSVKRSSLWLCAASPEERSPTVADSSLDLFGGDPETRDPRARFLDTRGMGPYDQGQRRGRGPLSDCREADPTLQTQG